MSYSNFDEKLSMNNYCDPKNIGIEYDTFSNIPKFDSNYNLQTALSELNNLKNKNVNNDEKLKNKKNKKRKMTHKDCIAIYKNPDDYNEDELSCALKHVAKCKICKKEISKQIEEDDDNEIGEDSISYKINVIDKINELGNSKIVSESSSTKDNFTKFQNEIFKEKISLLEKRIDELTENVKKIDKLTNMTSYNISQNKEIINSLETFINKNENNKNDKNDTKSKNNQEIKYDNTSYSILIYCSVFIVILLIIDIILRIILFKIQ